MPYHISRMPDFIEAEDQDAAKLSLEGYRRAFPSPSKDQEEDLETVKEWFEAGMPPDAKAHALRAAERLAQADDYD